MKSIGLAAVVLVAASTSRGAFTSLIDFGDSLSDVGNDYASTFGIAPAGPGYYNGRFSNGPIWVDQLSAKLGLGSVTPSKSGGNDYAYGGVTTGTGNTTIGSGVLSVNLPNIRTQINNWTGSHNANSGQLFTVLGGGNDLFANLDSGTTVVPPTTAADNIAGGVGALYADGARNIMVVNLPDLGKTPEYRTTSMNGSATSQTIAFNNELATDLNNLQTSSPGLHLYRVDLYSGFNAAISNPMGYGFTDVTDSAYTGDTTFAGNGTAVANPSGYLFWDQVHPTTTGHALLANAAFAAVPEPTTIGLVGVAVVTAASSRRRKGSTR